jgi:trimeric autotransporter adhesin
MSSYSIPTNVSASDIAAEDGSYEAGMSASFQELYNVAVSGTKSPTPATSSTIAPTAASVTQSTASLFIETKVTKNSNMNPPNISSNSSRRNGTDSYLFSYSSNNSTPSNSNHPEKGTPANELAGSRYFSSNSGPITNISSNSIPTNVSASDITAEDGSYEAGVSSRFQELFNVAVSSTKSPTPAASSTIAPAAASVTQSTASLFIDRNVTKNSNMNPPNISSNSSRRNGTDSYLFPYSSGSSHYADDVKQESVLSPPSSSTQSYSSDNGTHEPTTPLSTNPNFSTSSDHLFHTSTYRPDTTGNIAGSKSYVHDSTGDSFVSPSVSVAVGSSTQQSVTLTTSTSSTIASDTADFNAPIGMSGDDTDEDMDDISLSPAMQALFNVALTGDKKQTQNTNTTQSQPTVNYTKSAGLSRVARAAKSMKTSQEKKRLQQWRDLTDKYKYNETIIW